MLQKIDGGRGLCFGGSKPSRQRRTGPNLGKVCPSAMWAR
jgi:hypothetical protein